MRVSWTARRSNQSILNNPECSFLRTVAEAPIHWPLDAKSRLIGKDPEPGNHGRQKEKGAAEDKRVRPHHHLNAHKFEQTPGDGGGQRNLACCSPWECEESDMT